MFIRDILGRTRPAVSFEIFPPKPETPLEIIFDTIAALRKLSPDFISVTYGAGGSSRERTGEIASATRGYPEGDVRRFEELLKNSGQGKKGMEKDFRPFSGRGRRISGIDCAAGSDLRRRFFVQFRSAPEVGPDDLRISGEFRSAAALDEPPRFEDVAPVADFQRLGGVLLHEQHRHPPSRICRMVSMRVSTTMGARPREGSSRRRILGLPMRALEMASICCSPGKGAGTLLQTLLQDGKEAEAPFHVLRDPFVLLSPVRPHDQVFLHGEGREETAPFRHEGQPRATTSWGFTGRGLPKSSTVPPDRSATPARVHMTVDFPAPLEPTMDTISRSSREKEIPWTAWMVP